RSRLTTSPSPPSWFSWAPPLVTRQQHLIKRSPPRSQTGLSCRPSNCFLLAPKLRLGRIALETPFRVARKPFSHCYDKTIRYANPPADCGWNVTRSEVVL